MLRIVCACVWVCCVTACKNPSAEPSPVESTVNRAAPTSIRVSSSIELSGREFESLWAGFVERVGAQSASARRTNTDGVEYCFELAPLGEENARGFADLLREAVKGRQVIIEENVECRWGHDPVRNAGLSDDVTTRVISQNTKAFVGCIDNALRKNPTLKVGSVTVNLMVGPAGNVHFVGVTPKKYEQDEWATCLMSKAKRIEFPSAEGETELQLPFKVGVGL